MGIINRTIRNISRRKIRAVLVIISSGFSMAIMISIPAGVMINQQSATNIADNLASTLTQTGRKIVKEKECLHLIKKQINVPTAEQPLK